MDAEMNRREWLGSALAWALWPRLRLEPQNGLATAGEVQDEQAFWEGVRAAFELEPGQSNLVTVVRGVTPTVVRERVAEESQRLNAFWTGARPQRRSKAIAREKAAAFVGAAAHEVALLRNTTEGVTTVLMNWPLERGDEILTSSAEHGPFYDTLAQRAARDGIVVRRFHYPAPAPSHEAILGVIERALTPRTRLVMIGQVVLTGQVNEVRAIADLVHARGARLLVDGVLGVGHVETDVRAMDCDFYAAGFHKWGCGPRATAVFYARPELVERLPPLFGAYREGAENSYLPLWSSAEMAKYETFGAHPDAHFLLLADALDFLRGIGVDRIRQRVYRLTERWTARVARVNRFRSAVLAHPDHCAGLVAWELEGVDPERVRASLTRHGVRVGGTESYAGFFGIPVDRPRSLFIANAGVFTSEADVDRLSEAIEEVRWAV